MIRLLCRLLLIALFLAGDWGHAAMAGPVAAGTVIRNVATGSYIDASTGLWSRISSNAVSTTVAPQEALELTSNQNAIFTPGSHFVFSHLLTNRGNVASAVQLAVSAMLGGGFVPSNLHIVQDVNGNGTIDAGEPEVHEGESIALAAGQSVMLLVSGDVPAAATAGQTAQLALRASTVAQGAAAGNIDTLVTVNGPVVQTSLAASVSTALPGDDVTFSAQASNTGNAPAGPVDIQVDGASTSLFVLRIPVPANTSLSATHLPQASTYGARTLYHVAGAPSDAYVSILPAGAVADAVAWGMPQVAAGMTLAGRMTVTVHANAAGTLVDTAVAAWTVPGQSGNLTTASNTVQVALPVRPVGIAFYAGSDYSATTGLGQPGTPLYVQVDAAACNSDALRVLTVPVKVVSQLTGDTEIFMATETGPNTGVFRIAPNVPTANAASHAVVVGDGILEVLRNDVITASVSSCSGVALSATTTLLIDPAGVVYDSKTNLPLAGATVQLIDVTGAGNGGQAGGAARVFGADGVTSAPSTVVTGMDGRYEFLYVPASTYRIMVLPPAGHVFPSRLPVALQPADRQVDSGGSYGGSFVLAATAGAVHFDIPLDPGATGGMMIEKSASKSAAQIGDFVDYTVKFNNGTGMSLSNVVLQDQLPMGFSYVQGSARLNGGHLSDPAGGTGPALQFPIGGIAVAGQPVLTYRVRVGVGAQQGNGTNTAQAWSGVVSSNRSSVTVKVLGGVFSDKAYIVGKVYGDCSRAGVQQPGDFGIPGVRIYLEDGTYAVTDEDGKYSFYGLTPRTHVVKVDATTLPQGTTLEVLGNRNALDGGSLFADLTKGELFKANFAVAQCGAGVRSQIEARRKGMSHPTEILQAAGTLLSSTYTASTTDARTLPASGIIRLPGADQALTLSTGSAVPGLSTMPSAAGMLGAVGDPGGAVAPVPGGQAQPPLVQPVTLDPALRGSAPSTSAASSASALPAPHPLAGGQEGNAQPVSLLAGTSVPLEEVVPGLDATVGFIELRDGQVLPDAQIRVRVKGPIGAQFELSVNGKDVSPRQVGKKSSLLQKGVSAWEYIGVELQPGRNVLRVQVTDGFGNVRGRAEVVVLAPGPLARIELDAPAQAVADATTGVPVHIRLRDANGLPVVVRTPIVLHATQGQWQQTPRQPLGVPPGQSSGQQTFITGGEGVVPLLAPAQPGPSELSVTGGTVKGEATITFIPYLRPLIAAGVVTGTLNLRNLDPSALQPVRSADVFEREIQSASVGFNHGRGQVAARTAFFLKGKVLGSSLLTLAYDSDKPSDTTLFRDIQPNDFYPVYGDSSARGFEAQSTGKLYVLLQHGTSYVLLGDYSTQTDHQARQLTQYSRALNGVKGKWQQGAWTVEGYASRTSSSVTVQQFRANGTSGPFQLALNGVVNSQKVDILTMSRNQPSVVLKDTALAPFTDYEIEPYSGLLLLKSPVASVDEDLNPLYIRVSYSIDNGGPKHTVGGVDARVELAPGWTAGVTAMRDADPANPQSLAGLYASARLGPHTVATAEVARSRTDTQGTGTGERFDIKHEGEALQAHVWGVHTDAGFYNTSSTQSAGSAEYGAKIGYRLNSDNRLVAEALRTANSVTGASQTGAEIRLETSLPGSARLEVGVRHSQGNGQALATSALLPGVSSAANTASGTALSTTTTLGTVTGETRYTTARVKLSAPVPGLKGADVYGVFEQAMDGSGAREAGIGANYALTEGSKIYVRHDFSNTLTGTFNLSPSVTQYSTVAGISSTLPGHTQLFNEYRVGSAIDGRMAENALGLGKQWKFGSGIGLSASIQHIKPVSGVVADASSAVTAGMSYTGSASWKGSAQAQWQTSSTSRSWLWSGATAHRLTADWTLLNRALYSDLVNRSGGGQRRIVTLQSGAAWRPVESDVWNALGRIEYKRTVDTTLGTGLNQDETAWTAATNINWQPAKDWIASGRYAARWVTDRASGLQSRSMTQLLGGRLMWNLNDRWDAGLQAYRMWGDGATSHAVGAEIGYVIWKNLWLSLGYNVLGFKAADLAGDNATQRGAYLRLRFKFDENLFAPSSPAASALTVSPALP